MPVCQAARVATKRTWQRLGREVRARRAELGLAQGDLAARGGPSLVTVGQIERGQVEPQAVTLARLETALAWERGSAARILAGGDPTPVSHTVQMGLAGAGRLPAVTQSATGTVGPARDDAEHVSTGGGGRRDLSDYSLAELADEIRRRADAGT